MSGQSWTVSDDFSRDEFLKYAAGLYDKHGSVTFKWTTGRRRTNAQNAALHLFCRQLGETLNDAGFDARAVLKPEAEIPWDEKGYMVKNMLWRPIQEVMTGKESTTEPDPAEYPKIYEALMRHLGQKLGIHVPWPTKDREAA